MGLDMYLRGEKFYWNDFKNPKAERKEDGFKVESITLDLGYWRKHPDLHGFIINSFADGNDQCQRIELDADDLRKIVAAVKERRLPPTSGFFFGESQNDKQQIARDVDILERALVWLQEGDRDPVSVGIPEPLGAGMAMMKIKPRKQEPVGQSVTHKVIYQASW